MIQWHENTSFSHMSLLDLNIQSIWTWKYIFIHHILFPQHHQTQRITLIQIWYKTPSRLKPNSWKLVIQWHENASFSHMIFLDFEIKRIWKWNYISIHNIPTLWYQMDIAKRKHNSNKCDINMRVWGNGEEGMREEGDWWELELYGPSVRVWILIQLC